MTFVFECRLSLREALLLQVFRHYEGNATPRNDRGYYMEIGETLYVTTGDDFRKWLEENHKSRKEIWLILYK